MNWRGGGWVENHLGKTLPGEQRAEARGSVKRREGWGLHATPPKSNRGGENFHQRRGRRMASEKNRGWAGAHFVERGGLRSEGRDDSYEGVKESYQSFARR